MKSYLYFQEHQFLIQTSASSNSTPVTARPGQTTPSSTVQRRPGTISGQELIILCEDDLGCAQTNSFPSSTTNTTSISSAAPHSPFSNKPYARYSRRLSLFGRVNSRAECRPPPNTRYMMLKAQQVKIFDFI